MASCNRSNRKLIIKLRRTLMTFTGGQVYAQTLLDNGVKDIFLIPGVQLDWAVEALREHGTAFNLFVPRHEQSTTYMADGYYRVSGRPGIAMVVPGPGLLNATAGLATAYSCHSKVLLLTAKIHSQGAGKGFGLLHEIPDQTAILRSLCTHDFQVTDPSPDRKSNRRNSSHVATP